MLTQGLHGSSNESEFENYPQPFDMRKNGEEGTFWAFSDGTSSSSLLRNSNNSPGDSVHSDCSTNVDEGSKSMLKRGFLRIPELVTLMAKEGKALRWDAERNWFEVLNGPLFEENFNEWRCTREKRKEQAADRPFAR